MALHIFLKYHFFLPEDQRLPRLLLTFLDQIAIFEQKYKASPNQLLVSGHIKLILSFSSSPAPEWVGFGGVY